MQKKNLKKASGYYLIGTLFNKGFAFLTVPIFTRILSTSDYGIVTTYNSWISILSMIMGFAIYMGIRASFIDYSDKVDDFLSVCTTFTLLCGALTCLFVGGGAILLKVDAGITLIFLCLLQGLSAALVQNYSMYLMMRYQYKYRTALMVLPNLISVILSVIAILFVVKSDLYLGRIVPTALVNIGFGVLVVIAVYKKSKCLFNKSYLKYALAISAPLVLHGIALNILSQSDRTMITLLSSAAQTGIYSLIYNFSMIATVITTTLEGIWVPWFINKLKMSSRDEINVVAKDYINLMTYAMVALILVAPEVVKILANESYWEGISIIPPVVLANYVIFAYSLYVNIEHYYKKTPYITGNTIIAAASNIVLNFIFIPKYGYVAAAYTTLASYLISFVLHTRYAKKLEPNLYPLKRFIYPLIELLVVTILFYMFEETFAIRWAIMIIYILAMFYKERNRLKVYFPNMPFWK